ncbi:uncharacterized protein LOC108450866 [Gossypium arboreum]|uniref:RNase H type-1 domain-containing protein n=1 Tax=Gossypium arboreum TaxID=29729 RepID=A0ABR0Q0D8_GOSAR|nr:uncharacterized protein LOC108450866 [Gossypium arboreum]KAK5832536.1 hypothetical protein PVK06_016338 [Gossypium arboreum]
MEDSDSGPAKTKNISWTATEVVKASSCWARQYESLHGGYKNNSQNSKSINNLEGSWVYLSTDGAVSRDSGYAATGGLALDHEGNWIVGFNRFLGVCSPFEAEVWGILDGILILLSKGFRRIIILTDNLEVAQNLSTLNLEYLGIAVLRRTQRVMQSEGEWKIEYISRNLNSVADHLAKLSLNWKSNLQIIVEALKEILDLLQADKASGYFM